MRSRASHPVVRKRGMRRTARSAIDWEIRVLAVRTGFPKPERTARYSVFKDRSKPARGLFRARPAQGTQGTNPWFPSRSLAGRAIYGNAGHGSRGAGGDAGERSPAGGSMPQGDRLVNVHRRPRWAQAISTRAKRRLPTRIR
jgi:hypothetical protein